VQKTRLSLAFMIGLALALSSSALLARMGLSVGWLAVEAVHAMAAPSFAQSGGAFSLDWSTLDSGGGEVSGGTYQLQTTIAQSDAGNSSGGVFTLEGGYWPGNFQPWHIYLPTTRR